MVNSATGGSVSLPQALVERARSRAPSRLSADLVGGALVATAAALWRPAGWVVIASAGLCFAAFGGWGFADRLLDEPGNMSNRGVYSFLLIFRTIAVTIGVATALLFLFSLAGFIMGTWIS